MKKLLLIPITLLSLLLVWCNITEVKPTPIVEVKKITEIKPILWEKICATFTDEFVKNYRYSESRWYNFALKINWYYYNVFRNKNWWVSNSQAHGLTGAIPSYKFNEDYCWDIMYGETKVANKKDYWFHTMLFTGSNDIQMSPVKEVVDTHTVFIEYIR